MGNTYEREAREISNNLANNMTVQNSFNIYPNPADNAIRLDIESFENLHFKVHNVNGQILKTGQLNENKTIDIQSLSTGMYYIELSNGTTSRFVVLK